MNGDNQAFYFEKKLSSDVFYSYFVEYFHNKLQRAQNKGFNQCIIGYIEHRMVTTSSNVVKCQSYQRFVN